MDVGPRIVETVGDEQEWREAAACAGLDPDLFFVPRSASNEAARLICARCPVQPDCLDYALANNENHGIWGGKSELERRRIRRLRKAESA